MENGEHLSLEQVQAFLTGNEEIGFKAPDRKELYEWTQQALCAQSYTLLVADRLRQEILVLYSAG